MRLIDADELKVKMCDRCEFFDFCSHHREKDCPKQTIIDSTPTAVVLCKDCKHRDPEDHRCDCGAIERLGCRWSVDDNYFCAYGEK